jgi:hypothetical protein
MNAYGGSDVMVIAYNSDEQHFLNESQLEYFKIL